MRAFLHNSKKMKSLKNSIIFFLIAGLIVACDAGSVKEKKTEEFNDVPSWSKEAIWYQIFVERFRNGDPSNDPTREDIRGTYPDSIPLDWTITPWGQDWYRPDAWFASSGLKEKWNNLQLRRYGGDLQGVIDQIPYLQSLGINAIYFNPLNDSPSLHKYDPRNWHHIDRNFGPNPKKDKELIASENPLDPTTWVWTTADSLFLKLINKCHEAGIRVVLDYSFNHTGKDFWAFNDVKKYGKQSKVADWYEIEEFDNPETPVNEFTYKGWSNVPTMPEMKKDYIGQNKEMQFEGNLHSQEAKNHIFSVAKRWLDPNGDGNPEDGLDGYRLDVAAEVPMGFWRDFRKVVREINPEAYLIGEIWWKTWPDTLLLPTAFLQGDQFDAIMNYRWYRPARQFFNDMPDALSVSEFVVELKDKMTGIDINRQQAMMNLVASHDAPRVSTDLYNKNPYKYQAKVYDNHDYKIDKPDEHTRKLLKMLLIHQFTYIGSPHIWNGDEMGMWGGDDPDTRKPVIWPDIVFEDETHHPFDLKRKTDKVEQDKELIDFCKQLIRMRKSNPALIYGDIEFTVVDDTRQVLAYTRKSGNKTIMVVFNKSDNQQKIDLPANQGEKFIETIENKEYIADNSGKLSILLEPLKAIVLIKQ